MLYIAELVLSHFRSHRRTGLKVDTRPVAIHGDNGAGKTNILEAISLLSPGRGLRRAVTADIARRPDAIGWKLDAILTAPDNRHEVSTWSEDGTSRQVRVNGKAASQVVLGRLARVVWLVPAMDRLWIEAAEGRRRFLDRLALSFFPDHAEAALGYERAMRERNRLLKDQVQDPAWYGALEAQMADAGHRMHVHRLETLDRLDRAQQQATTAFPVASLKLTQSEGEMPGTQEDLRIALAEGRPRDLAAGRALLGPHRADLQGRYAAKNVPAAECSTGEQKALLISLVLANARALKAEGGSAPIILLDEVAAHLDADRRGVLYDEICALGAQAWLTGTGPELFSDLGERAQYLRVTEEDGISVVDVT